MQERRVTWQGGLLAVFFALGALVPAAASWWYYRQQREAATYAISQDLIAVTDGRVGQISNWRRERLGDGYVLATYRPQASSVLSRRAGAESERNSLVDVLGRLEQAYLYSWGGLLDRDGNVILQSKALALESAPVREFAQKATTDRDVELQDLYWDKVAQHPMMALTVPVPGQGAFVLEIDPLVSLFPALGSWPGARASSELVLARRAGNDVFYLGAGRSASESTIFLHKIPWGIQHLPDSALDTGWFSSGIDYRGVPVFRAIRRIPDSPWYIGAKVDVQDAFLPLRHLGLEMAVVLLLIVGINAAGAGLVWRNHQLRIQRDQRAWFQRIADGTPTYLWSVNESGQNSFLNRPLAEFLGLRVDDLGAAKPAEIISQYVHPDDATRVSAELFDCLKAQRDLEIELRLRRFDGEYRWILSRGRCSFSEDRGFAGYVGAMWDITERKQAEAAARESLELLQTQNRLLEQIANGAPLKDSAELLLRSIEASDPTILSSILLLDEDGIHIHPLAAPNLPQSYNEAIDGEPIGEAAGSCGTAAYRRESVIVEDIATDPLWDSYRDLALSYGLRACWSTPILDEQQRVLGTFALYSKTPRRPSQHHWKLIENATHTARIAIMRHRTTEALRLSEERLRLAVTGAHIGIWEWNSKTQSMRQSREWKEMLGRACDEPAEIPLESAFRNVHPDDRVLAEPGLRHAMDAHMDYKSEFRILLADGSLKWIAAFGRGEYDAGGNPVRMLGVSIDITDRKKAEEEIRRREVQLIEAQHLAKVGSYEWDLATGRVSRSPELYRIFGLEGAEFAPTFEGYLEHVHPDHRASTRATIEQALRDQKPFAFEEKIVRPNGEVRILDSQGKWVFDEAGHLIQLVGTCQDITDRKRAEQQLLEANATLQTLSARLIHAQEQERARIARELHDDLSQQIAALSIGVANLKNGLPSELNDLRLLCEQIQQRAIYLGEGVRRLSHELHPAMLEHADLASVLRSYCLELQEMTGLKVTLCADGMFIGVPPNVALAVFRIAQEALQNVVKHAKVREAAVSIAESSGVLSLAVSDRGVGMSLKQDAGKMGLGLISMKERARLISGLLDIQSRLQEGTVVTITVPETWAKRHSA